MASAISCVSFFLFWINLIVFSTNIYFSIRVYKADAVPYTPYKQYKCTEDGICPENYTLLIEDKGKCIEDCGKDDIYKYQYNGKCLKECPINTESKNNDNICKDIDLNKCIVKENNFISLVDNLTDNEIKYYAKNVRQYINNISKSTYNTSNQHVKKQI